jgi:DNA (cytosine-5)-methyltransferase 1
MALTVGSLFAGIGGFDLGFERAGFEIKWQVEIDPFCRKVLEKHWPHVRRYEDVRTVGDELERVDVICGGFPCQDISLAGKRVGIDGERSGLWRDFSRLVRAVRPRYVVVENVPALLGRGLGRVLRDLAESGYDAEWDCIPARAFGADHFRDRAWVVSYARRIGQHGIQPERELGSRGAVVFGGVGVARGARRSPTGFTAPRVGRAGDGIPDRVDRLRGLGNAIVPQIAEWIAERIKDAEAQRLGAGRDE